MFIGHIGICAIYVINFFLEQCDEKIQKKLEHEDHHDCSAHEKEKTIAKYGSYGAIAMYLKLFGDIGLYLFPMLYMCYLLNRFKSLVTHFDTPYLVWLYIETQLYACWLISSVIFMALTYLFKY